MSVKIRMKMKDGHRWYAVKDIGGEAATAANGHLYPPVWNWLRRRCTSEQRCVMSYGQGKALRRITFIREDMVPEFLSYIAFRKRTSGWRSIVRNSHQKIMDRMVA